MALRALIEARVQQFFRDDPDSRFVSENKRFLVYCTWTLLKPASLDYDQVVAGITDDSGDCGVDAIYVFSSGQLLEEDSDLDSITADAQVELKVVQVTTDNGFKESQMLKTKSGVDAIFSYREPLAGNDVFRRRGELARNAVKRWASASNANALRVNVYYICFGDASSVNQSVSTVAKKLVASLAGNCAADARVHYLGAKEVFALGSQDSYSGELRCRDVIEYVDRQNNPGLLGWLGIVDVKSLLGLLANDQGQLDPRYFQYNVRDYYGNQKKVNRNIAETLKSEARRNFWCLNNGVTIVCRQGNKLDKDLTLRDFQVVNGCQTVNVLNECRGTLENDDSCRVVVKIIQTTDEQVEADIVDATNSQTAVLGTALHANEPIQKAIEAHFLGYHPYTLYYERRINFYRRRLKPASRIVPVIRLFQVMYSIFWRRPGQSRNNPSRTFEDNYGKVFDVDYDYDAYLIAYLLYLRLYSINRDNIHAGSASLTEQDVMDYGMLHLVRTACALLRHSDSALDLKGRKSEFQKLKGDLFAALDDNGKMEDTYTRSMTLVESAISDYKIAHVDAVGSNILRNDEFDEKYLTRAISKCIRGS
ncbi:MAG: hypothetical protein C0398_07530 [Coprothermobacter sp.]|nr:hypothetical protein [Coprothermobacter sp.]